MKTMKRLTGADVARLKHELMKAKGTPAEGKAFDRYNDAYWKVYGKTKV